MGGIPEHPDPDSIRTIEDLRRGLKALWGPVPYNARRPELAKATVGGLLGGKDLTCPSLKTLETFLRVCGVRPPETERWIAARDRVERARPLPLVCDAVAVALGVRQSIRTPGTPIRSAEPPRYVSREHDRELREIVSANDGRPRLVLLVGRAATGKSRSAYEALRHCVPDWGLLAPAPEDARNAVGVATENVVWLDQAQPHLTDAESARALLKLMTTREGNILIVGTLWHDQWNRLRGGPAEGRADPYRDARRLLGMAVRVDVPDAFDEVEVARAHQEARLDPRLRVALAACRDSRTVTQVLAGGPEIVEHHKDAKPLPKAVLDAAIDARRLGVDGPLPASLLRSAAFGYLNAKEKAAVEAKPDRRFEKALKYCREERGGLAALTLVSADEGGAFELDGYLADQEGDRRRGRLVPAEIWDAFTRVGDTRDRRILAREAARRGLYRHAGRFAWPLAVKGDVASMYLLAEQYERLTRADDADEWWRRAAEIGGSYGAVRWARRLEEKGDTDAAEGHWRKASEAGDAYALWQFADRLQLSGRVAEAEDLWEQAVRLGDPFVIERYTDWLTRQGRAEVAEQLWREVSRTGRVLSAQWLGSAIALSGLLDDTDRKEEARRKIKHAADNGHPTAMRRLAMMLEADGDRDGSRDWLVRAADGGDVVAIRDLARRDQEDGRAEEAENWFHRAATAGDTYSMWQLAELADRDGRTAEAEQWLRRAGDRGDTHALAGLAERMERAGRSTEAERLWRDAGGNGHPPALEHLAGFLRRHGREAEADRLKRYGIEPDGRTAQPWEPGAG
ncbi:hypothetical protein [Actinomadura sp. DC4]|uniref:hypothetical protein n=1 Tax=Actinomadura sp. DC4 TaxID=3055069 RepID=UPI0025B14A54|nr:hypothetical protein [Actinomadura sp. DC4]MDN3357643.1 hypothetical protein [Actinomadura sp. DC4]